jgi:hypothetical protein
LARSNIVFNDSHYLLTFSGLFSSFEFSSGFGVLNVEIKGILAFVRLAGF